MIRILLSIIILLLSATPLPAENLPSLQNLKRPRYETGVPPQKRPAPQLPHQNAAIKQVARQKVTPDNSRFAGKFSGLVTIHYKNKMVRTKATLTISTNGTQGNSHYDYYLIPDAGDYLEHSWKLDEYDVQRTVTVSGSTLYITDIIDYGGNGGNSQIRTLVFSGDYSALTFLKTEFDDELRDTATGQIIGRFIRID
ncbi:hypothetical protein [Maridesulfovibrio hydrothermalis]|uniref:Uncharacterized protein n=1 Tax=Maridesulfovibrio hydrothermalis AM13 = DSM 14728 TaxID=1121451 RepID=L0RAK3_9BACT|nr:hypothetical protein [Maridesulfovibrio hydrothermalis]CCO23784.1 conserved exported protein of unknown function [Maridesulfovibrio hydrothermalis AM13 = DSM 14728]